MKLTSKTILLSLTLMLAATSVLAQDKPDENKTQANAPADTRIPRNSKVYIAPMDGYETYLAAAFRKKEVPLVIVTEPEYADFVISGTHDKKNAGWAKTIFMGDTRGSPYH